VWVIGSISACPKKDGVAPGKGNGHTGTNQKHGLGVGDFQLVLEEMSKSFFSNGGSF